MNLKRIDENKDLQSLRDKCKRFLNYHVVLMMEDGQVFDGIIESVDEDGVTVLVGEDVIVDENNNQLRHSRQMGRPRRFRRFRRRRFPLNLLLALSLLQFPF